MGSSSSIKDDELTKNIRSIFLNEADLGYRETFNIFDVNENHKISRKEIEQFYGSLKISQNETQQEKADEVDQDDQEFSLDYPEFKKLIEDYTKEPPLNDKIKMALSIFDRDNKGYISKNQMRYILSSIGDKLTEAEVKEFMAELNPRTENVDYAALANELCENENK